MVYSIAFFVLRHKIGGVVIAIVAQNGKIVNS